LRIIATHEDVAAGIRHLAKADPRLGPVIASAGDLPLRRREGGFEGLVHIVVGQQLSITAAAAIWERLRAAYPDFTPATLARAREPKLRKVGLSAAKVRTVRAIAAAVRDGLDLDALATMEGDLAHGRLTAVHGIGPWTADIYLMFCLGHPDVFPVGDLALRNAVADAFGLEIPAPPAEIAAIAQAWSPWRSVAATLFWAYYGARKQRKVAPL
jgi:DNA-3-methyladenine glycosylase II